MVDSVLLLGAAVVRTACKLWTKDQPWAADATGSVLDVLQAQVAGARDGRRVRRLFEDMEERVHDTVLQNMDIEFRAVPDNDREAAVLEVRDTLDRASLKSADLFAADLDAARLLSHVRRFGRTKTLSQDTVALYERVLRDCCAYVVEMANVLPGFEVGVFGELLTRQHQLMRQLDERFERLPMQLGGAGAELFEPTYLRLVGKQLDKVELFGVTASDRVTAYPLSVAYVSLSIRGTESDDDVTSIEDALAHRKRAFVRGEAGSGKTTLLQWLAVRAARREFPPSMADWNDCVPFFIRLRRYTGRDMPAPEDFLHEVGASIAHSMPMNWMGEVLSSGRALLLVDGVDELPEQQRRAARRWLQELLTAYPRARCVVTSRPTAAAEDWLGADAFDALEVQPMTLSDIDAFVAHWHEALSASVPDAEQDRIARSRQSLTRTIRHRHHLRTLAVSPLMTALICALHLDRRGQLPDDRMELYAIALEMLLERRDSEREISVSGVRISRADKMLILEDIAYWLVRNGWTDVAYDRVLERLATKLADLHRVEGEPQQVLTHLLERSGLLRMPVVGRIDFVHKTFQEYLGARAAVNADDTGVLAANAHDDQWREVVLLAVGHARPQQTEELLRAILAQADKSPDDNRYVLEALAMACLQYAPSVAPELRDELRRRAAYLVPPKNLTHATAVAGAGEMVLDLLTAGRWPAKITETAATIRMAATIGGDRAMDIIAECARRKGRQVRDELERAWSKFDPEEFASRVLTEVPELERVRLNDPSLLPGLRLLDIRALTCRFAHGHGDVDYIRALPGLDTFRLRDPMLHHLGAIAGSQLTSLHIEPGTSELDLTPLADCRTLRDLSVPGHPMWGLAGLDTVDQITSLDLSDPKWVVGDFLQILAPTLKLTRFATSFVHAEPDLRDFLAARPLAALRSLTFRNMPALRTLAGVGQWAETMTSIQLHAPALDDVSSLVRLPKLEVLNLTGTPVESLEFVRDLPALRRLQIGRQVQPIPDLAPLRDHPTLKRLTLVTDDWAWPSRLYGVEIRTRRSA
jgi:hypothetical protein